MLYLFLLYLSLSLIGINFNKINLIDETALDRERTTMINGFFVGLVFFSHFNSYVNLNGSLNNIYIKIFNLIGQLMVTTFLFYSGFGVLESIKNKKDYINSFFKKRILKLFIYFAIAVLMYLILAFAIGKSYPLKTILLSFIGWESIGNSNWFIFAIICMYFSTLISFKIFKKDIGKGIIMNVILSVIYMILMAKFRGYGWWYDTVLCYNLGMIISYYKDSILKFLKNKWNYILIIILMISIIVLCRFQRYNALTYNIGSMSFVTIVLLISLRIKIGNKFLLWLGKNTFNIYILQRLSFILFEKIGIKGYNVYLYFLLSICTTIVLTIIFDKFIKLVNKLLKL